MDNGTYMVDKIQVFIIADYGRGDPAFVEVDQYISAFVPGAAAKYISVEPFSTTHTGFWTYQIAVNDMDIRGSKSRGAKTRTYIYTNTAPRRDNKNPRMNNEGEPLAYAKLSTGLEIVGVLSGESFSYIKPMIKEIRLIRIPPGKGKEQFRSRRIFTAALGRIVSGDYSCLGEKVKLGSIPEPRRARIAHVDSYGNIKLTSRASDLHGLKAGDRVAVSIGDRRIVMRYTGGVFSVSEGEFSLAPGSSGANENRFLEIMMRLGNAWEAFGCPRVESEVSFGKAHGPATLPNTRRFGGWTGEHAK